MKEIKKEEVKKLVENGVIINTPVGFVNRNAMPVGFRNTRHKKYIEDKYALIAKKIK